MNALGPGGYGLCDLFFLDKSATRTDAIKIRITVAIGYIIVGGEAGEVDEKGDIIRRRRRERGHGFVSGVTAEKWRQD
jgi:hypothetical protein